MQDLREHPDHGPTSAQERGGRSVSRDRGAAGRTATSVAASSASTTGATNRKHTDMDLLEENPEDAPPISSADLDQLMADMDMDDPLLDDSATATSTKAATSTTETKPTDTKAEEKPSGLAGALPGGLGAGLSSIPNPMGEAGGNILGKLGDLATQNPVTDGLSKGKDFFFKKFGL